MSDEANSAAWKAAGQAVSTGVAAIGQDISSRKQFNRSKELMSLQMQNQERLNESAYARQLQMWKDTNFSAQRKEMEKAGLNVGSMYGKSGGGGSTVGSNSAGSAASGQVPNQAPFDIGQIVAATKSMAELGMLKASTRKTNADAKSVELDNVYQQENEIPTKRAESTVRYQKATGAENAFLSDDEMYKDEEKARVDYQKLIRNGKVSENEVASYRAELAKAKIDPDSNP